MNIVSKFVELKSYEFTPWTMDMNTVESLCHRFSDNFKPHFIFSAVQFTILWR
jgi:hypothetical protein